MEASKKSGLVIRHLDVSVDMSVAIKTLLWIYLASQMPTAVEAQETEREPQETESLFLLLSSSEWLFILGVLLGWDFLKAGSKRLWRCFCKRRHERQGKQDSGQVLVVKEELATLLRGSRVEAALLWCSQIVIHDARVIHTTIS